MTQKNWAKLRYTTCDDDHRGIPSLHAYKILEFEFFLLNLAKVFRHFT